MLRTWLVRFPASVLTLSVRSFRLTAELALRAHLAGHAGDLVGEGRELVDHLVDRGGDAAELSPDRLPVDRHSDLLGQVAVGDRVDHPGHLGRRPHEALDHGVDGVEALPPGPRGAVELGALREPAFPADHLADADDLARRLLAPRSELVVGLRQLGENAPAAHGQTDAGVASCGRVERLRYPLELFVVDTRAVLSRPGLLLRSTLGRAR
jgi:hypothetical protein